MINKAILIGRLGAKPELKYLQNGDPVCNFNMATTEMWKDKTGEKQEKVEWHKIVVFRKLAEICAEYLDKGSLIYVEGRIQTRQWEDKDGVKRTVTEIVASNMKMLGTKKSDSNEAHVENVPADDVPF